MTPILKTCLSLMLANQQSALLIPDPVQNIVKSRIEKQWAANHADHPIVWDRDECSDRQDYDWSSSDIKLMGSSYSITEILEGRSLPLLMGHHPSPRPEQMDAPPSTSQRTKSYWWVMALAGLAVGGAVIAGQIAHTQPATPGVQPTDAMPAPKPTLSTGVSF